MGKIQNWVKILSVVQAPGLARTARIPVLI
jgi:hypothetical protein